MMEIGDHVIYVDEFGKEHDALVTAVWSRATHTIPESYGDMPGLNLVYVSKDENAHDQYGRQLAERPTSVVHESAQPAHGRKWRMPTTSGVREPRRRPNRSSSAATTA